MIYDQIQEDLVTALRGGDSLAALVLRSLLSELNYKKIELQKKLEDEQVVGVIAREIKKRKEAIESFTVGGRTEQAETEKKEMAILQKYAPALMSEDEVRAEMAALELSDNIGGAMKIVSPIFKGRADMAMVSKIVREKLVGK